MSYDHWKTTNPEDRWLGPDPDEDEPELTVIIECARCRGDGEIGYSHGGPDYIWSERCRACNGTGLSEDYAELIVEHDDYFEEGWAS